MEEIKSYIPSEERWNVLTHAAGALLALFGMAALFAVSTDLPQKISAVIYGISMFLLFLGSASYHAAKVPAWRLKLRRVDHAAIHLLISGTYTPLFLAICRGKSGMIVLAISWLISLVGISLELSGHRPPKAISVTIYLISGWLCIFMLQAMIHALGMSGLFLLVAGGAAYSAGTVFYVSRRNYAHAIWHVFVLVGALLQYLAIYCAFQNPVI